MAGFFTSLDDIVSGGFCIGCGLCAAVAPKAGIEMRLSPERNLRPEPARPLDQMELDKVLKTCPGVTLRGPFTADDPESDPMVPMDPVWGAARRVARGHATDAETRFRASTGGIMTAINRHLLRTREVAFVLQVAPDPNDAFGSVVRVCRTEADLMTHGGSRYGTSAPLKTIMDVLALGEPFSVSLKPCDIAGLNNLRAQDARARDLIRFTQAMFCGTVPSFGSTRAFFERRGLSLDDQHPVSFRWRGEGCPGPTRAEMPDGNVLEGTYNELWVDNPWTTQFRCKICPDAVGLQADLAVGDDWPGGAPIGEDAGWNALIAHTETGLRILNAAEAAGDLNLIDVDIRHLDAVQPHHVKLRREVAARLAACETAGLPRLEFADLGLERTAAQACPDALGVAYAGTLDRLRRHKGTGG